MNSVTHNHNLISITKQHQSSRASLTVPCVGGLPHRQSVYLLAPDYLQPPVTEV